MKKFLTTIFISMLCLSGFASHYVTATGSNINCYGQCNGAANAFATGGVGPYGYSWTGPSGYTGSGSFISGLCAGTYVVTATDSSDMSTAFYTLIITEPSQIVSTTPGTLQTCLGSCVTVWCTASGGNPPYAYNWAPAVGLSCSTCPNPIACPTTSVTYTVTISDGNGCVASNIVSVMVNPLPTISLTPNPTSCTSCTGSIANSTTGAISYSWTGPSGYSSTNTNLTNLCAGTFTLNATSSAGCVATGTSTVGGGSSLTASISGTSATCNGLCNGSLTATASGGTPPYTYLWMPAGITTPTATNLCAGTYTVTVSDNVGCTFTAVGTVIQPAQIITNLSPMLATCGLCDGAINSSTTGGTAPYNYSWSPGAMTIPNPINLCAGTYILAVTDANGCTQTTSTVVSSAGGPAVTYNTTPSACSPCTGTVTLIQSGGTAPYLYDLNNGSAQQTSNVFNNVCSGAYVGMVTDANGCVGVATMFVPNAGISGLTITQNITQESGAGLADGSIDLTLTGSSGPYTFLWSNGATTEDIYSLSGGVYSLTITDAGGNCATYTYTVATTPNYGYITGVIYNDVNQNCVFDAGDSPLVNYWVSVTNGTNTYMGITNSAGVYSIWVPSGNYSVVPQTLTNLTSGCATSYNVTVTNGSTIGNNNFSYNVPAVYDVCVSTWSPGIVPGFNGTYYVYLSNYSTLPVSGSVCITLPSILTYLGATPAAASVSGSTVCWNYTNITAGMTVFTVNFNTPSSAVLGTPTIATVNATVTSGTDINPGCNTYVYTRLITGSFDPNDKTVSPSGIGATGDIQTSENEFSYLIRFQNTGTAPAVNVVISDTISNLLDVQSIEILNASHNYMVELLPNNLVRFKFDNIMLPDSTSNEPASHGHIQFKINTANAPIVGQVIENTGYIYFDFNEAVITNTAINTYVAPAGISDEFYVNGNISVSPNPFTDVTTFVINSTKTSETYSFELYDVLGKKINELKNISAKQFSINRNNLENGMYFYKIYSSGSTVGSGKVIVQ